jgi:hypothetical protein
MVGSQIIAMDIEVKWIPKVNGQQIQGQIVNQVWQSHIEVNSTSHWIDMGQISISSLITGFIGSGLTIPWLWEQVEKRKKEKYKEENANESRPLTSKSSSNDIPDEEERKL